MYKENLSKKLIGHPHPHTHNLFKFHVANGLSQGISQSLLTYLINENLVLNAYDEF